MKVYISPSIPNGNDGIYRVIQGQHTWLPRVGIEVVDDPFKADVLNVHIASFPASYPKDIPIVLSNHGLYWTKDQPGWAKWATHLNRSIIDAFRVADLVTVPSRWVQYAIERNFLFSPRLVHHGIDTDEWVPGKNERYVLWNKARADIACDPKIVNDLAVHFPGTTFVTTFGNKAPNVKVVGKQTPQEMKGLVQGAAVYLATAKETGGPCFGVLEAMACGVPVLTWNDGGTAEVIVHKETGYVADSFEDMIRGIRYCYEHRERLGAAARQVVIDRYQWKDVALEYGAVYEEAVSNKPEVKTSIIITNHTLGKFVGEAIESALEQEDREVIVVDDASTDNSLEIIESYKDKIRLIALEQNVHVAEARNIGIRAARGKYILPLDADDRLAPGAVKILSKALDEDRSLSIAYGAMQVFDETGKTFVSQWPPATTSLRQQLNRRNQLMYSSMYRRKVWEIVGGYRRRIRTGVEDADFWTRALSYNCTAKQVTSNPTLLYRIRRDSLSNSNQGEDWTAWFPWRKNDLLMPAGATEYEGFGYPIAAYSDPKVSVVIPVGPKHGPYLQGALDSLLAQTNEEWEVIVVNDTGEPLDYYLNGFPFVTLIDKGKLSGVAEARNEGIMAARGKYIVFLDADDLLEPQAIDIFLAAIEGSNCGWYYSDWLYKDNNGTLVKQPSEEWSSERLVRKSISAITGIYRTADVQAVGFDQKAPGWEDWIFHLSLLERGICGTRIASPLFYYNMKSGMRREDNFEKSSSLVQYVRNKFANLISDVLKGNDMCKSCGGKKSTVVVPKSTTIATRSVVSGDSMVTLRYVGKQKQFRRIPSRSHRGVTYRIGGVDTLINVFPEDVEWLTSSPDLVLADEQPHRPAQTVTIKQEEAPIAPTNEVLKEPSAQKDVRTAKIDQLDLPEEVITILGRNYTHIFQVSQASDAELLSIKGIGDSRLAQIREAVKKWNR